MLSEFLDFSRVRATNFERLDLLEVARDAARVAGEHPDAKGVEIVVSGSAVDVEADDDSLAGLGELDVGLVDPADGGVQDADLDLVGAQPLDLVLDDVDGALNIGLQDDEDLFDVGVLHLTQNLGLTQHHGI